MSEATAPVPYASLGTPTASRALPELAKTAPRIDALDLLRGFSILGIFLMNTWTMSLPQDTYTNPATYNPNWIPYMGFPVTDADGGVTYGTLQPLTGVNHWVYVCIHLFADMKFITTFSMLFGAGIVLQAERSRIKGKNPWTTHYLRMAVLLCFGLVHTFGFWYGDILTDYAMCGVILAPIRVLPAWLLFLMGIAMVWVPTGVEIVRENHEQALVEAVRANDDQDAAESTAYKWVHALDEKEIAIGNKGWEVFAEDIRAKDFNVDDLRGENDRELIAYHGSWWGEIVGHRFWCSIQDHTTGFLTWTFWRCGGCFLIGMGLQKRRFFHGAWPLGTYATIASFAIPVGWTVSYMGVMFNVKNGWSADWYSSNSVYRMGSLFNYWGSLLCSFGYMSVGVLLAAQCARPSFLGSILNKCLMPFRSIGRMALTCYLTETLIGTTYYYRHAIFGHNLGLGNFGHTTRLDNLYLVFPTWAFLLVFATVWLTVFRQGPLEWFWHSLVYWDWKNPAKGAAGPDASVGTSVAGSAGM